MSVSPQQQPSGSRGECHHQGRRLVVVDRQADLASGNGPHLEEVKDSSRRSSLRGPPESAQPVSHLEGGASITCNTFWHRLRGARRDAANRWYRFAQPPATVCQSFGLLQNRHSTTTIKHAPFGNLQGRRLVHRTARAEVLRSLGMGQHTESDLKGTHQARHYPAPSALGPQDHCHHPALRFAPDWAILFTSLRPLIPPPTPSNTPAGPASFP